MPAKLSDNEIRRRLTEGRNYKRLYHELKAKYDAVVTENKQLKAQIAELTAKFERTTETQAARIEELETMVFGRKPSGGTNSTGDTGREEQEQPEQSKQPNKKSTSHSRSSNSTPYRRPIPPGDAVTGTKHHTIDNCHRCGHSLTNKREAIRYEEDIVLAALTPDVPATTVTKHTVESGWCSHCGQYSSAKDLRGQVVTLGPVVRTFIAYLITHARLSFSQTADLLRQVFHFQVTEAEIAVVLAERRQAYLPVYEQLKTNIREGPAHFDETSYPIQSEQGDGYAWAMAGADGSPAECDIVFRLADSRGKGSIEVLAGKSYQGVGITDRYAGYKHAFVCGKHQICWAHLHRNARDITRLQCLSVAKREHVTAYYKRLSRLYAIIRTCWAQTFDRTTREQQAALILDRIVTLNQPDAKDPKKLQDLKAGILEYSDCLLVCLTEPNVPPDNNKAERSLRKLVLKRKNSFGVKTPKGARTMEVLFSVCQSLYNRDRDNLLRNLHLIAESGVTLGEVGVVGTSATVS